MNRCFRIMLLPLLMVLCLPVVALSEPLKDALGQSLELTAPVERVICSGPGCLRLLVYLQAQDRAVAVDDMETKRSSFDARPYALANPQFKELPTFGEFRGHDNPELILALEQQPQLIFKTYRGMGMDPKTLQQKTGIPVLPLDYGNLGKGRDRFFASLRAMGAVLGKEQRAEEVIAFFQETIADLEQRTADIPEEARPRVFIGGVAMKGPHGFHSTEPTYPPFGFVNARNLAAVASPEGKELSHADIAKEKIVEWDPDVLFLDLSTLQMGEDAGGLHELRTDPAYQTLGAVRQGKVHGVLPYNWYTTNYGSVLADAYFIGTILYPERFADIDPKTKTDDIYSFLVGKPVFAEMNDLFQGLVFSPLSMQ
jgi:iron complex transport system substrate-binding protein